jgi:hypothetical protein
VGRHGRRDDALDPDGIGHDAVVGGVGELDDKLAAGDGYGSQLLPAAGYGLNSGGNTLIDPHEGERVLSIEQRKGCIGRVFAVSSPGCIDTVLPRRQLETRAIDSFLDLEEDDLVVHLSHGIARYRGMHILEKNGQTEEHLILEFAGGTRVYVPASKIDLVQKYVGGAKSAPTLSKIGSGSWERKKQAVSEAVAACAEVATGKIAHATDAEWVSRRE